MHFAIALIACLGVVSAEVTGPPPGHYASQRIVGGGTTTINNYPFAVALLYSQTQTTFVQTCGGSIINNRSILTSASCFWNTGMIATRWRGRVGSSFASSGGTIHLPSTIMNHPQYNPSYEDNDFSILRVSTFIQYLSNTVAPANIASSNYNIDDNQIVWAIGWGFTWPGTAPSDLLRHVQVWTINQELCVKRYATRGYRVTDSMLCSGYLNVGGRDQCQGDTGSPLLHNNVIVGIRSWGIGCADPYFPGVNARVSVASNWIEAMA